MRVCFDWGQAATLATFALAFILLYQVDYRKLSMSSIVASNYDDSDGTEFNGGQIPIHQISHYVRNDNSYNTTTIMIHPRAFDPWPLDRPLPCFAPRKTKDETDLYARSEYFALTKARRGFLYQKTPKCASTTSAGVNLRISRNVARRIRNFETMVVGNNNATNLTAQLYNVPSDRRETIGRMCDNRWSHGKTARKKIYAMRFRRRKKEESFLWTIVRNPTKRFISHFMFGPVTGEDTTANLNKFTQYVNENRKAYRYYYNCILSTQRHYDCNRHNPTEEEVVRELNEIILEYDFIGLVERYSESLVVLMMLLHLPMSDILDFSAKSSATGFGVGRGCLPIQSKSLNGPTQKYLDSPEWHEYIKFDEMFVQAVNRSLDLTIHRLGQEKVQRNVLRFDEAQRKVEEFCQDKVVMPCSEGHEKPRGSSETDCLFRDIGCGTGCLDSVATTLDLWGEQ